MDPLRGQGPRSAIVFTSRCDETKKDESGTQLKSFQLDKVQLLDAAEGKIAVPTFQRLRRLAMRISPQNNDARKRNLRFTQESASSLQKCRNLRSVPVDASLGE